jgi:Zn-finger nucleic acid-binding protein
MALVTLMNVRKTIMKCPSCQIELTKKKLNDIEVDECPTCQGIWFEKDELRQAKDAADPDLKWMDFEIWKHEDQFKISSRNRPCPQCNQAMAVVRYGNTRVKIDCCALCKGVWLDKGEFKKIIRDLNNELLNKSFPRYILASLEEAAEILIGPESFISEWKDLCTVLRMMQYRLLAENPKIGAAMKSVQESNILG